MYARCYALSHLPIGSPAASLTREARGFASIRLAAVLPLSWGLLHPVPLVCTINHAEDRRITQMSDPSQCRGHLAAIRNGSSRPFTTALHERSPYEGMSRGSV